MTPSLARLLSEIDRAVRQNREPLPTVDAVAAAMWPWLRAPDLLTPGQRRGDAAGYRQHLLHVAPDGAFSVVALVWLPGQTTPVHDHVTWCVVGVHQGEEHEVLYRFHGDHLTERGSGTNAIGSVTGLLPPGDIHLVRNPGTGPAISLHVYGADLRVRGTSIRRRYDVPVVPTATAA